MYTLRLTQHPESEHRYRVEVALEGEGLPRQVAVSVFDFRLTAQEGEDLRWYLEDFLQHPWEPAPKIAARVELRLREIGLTLFRAVFRSGDDSRDLWATLREHLSDTRIEVVAGIGEAALVPWELIRDPTTDVPLALRARAFLRVHPQPTQRPPLPRAESAPMRVLLVICRPGGDDDVPFRSVAVRILKGLSETPQEDFQLDVLRPPTFERLGEVLRAARVEGQPYHVVHFDGHGMYLDLEELFSANGEAGGQEGELPEVLADFDPHRYSPRSVYPRAPRPGRRGYLAFENSRGSHNLRLVDGPELGALLAETGTPVLILNACRSAHAEPPATPDEAPAETNPHEKVRAFGSLAQEVMDAGVTGVVAMRYNVYVVTAAQFVADLYAALAEGQTFGEAATLGRKKLHAQPLREIAYGPLPLQDWPVPVVYEAAPLALLPRRGRDPSLNLNLKAGQAVSARGALDPQLPRQPDAGFFGRDGTLLKLDRLFDTQRVVLLHAYAGSGKTATVAEFARWYALTDGVDGPVLFTSFEQYRTLPRVLDQLGQVFGEALERSGINWPALDDAARRLVALQVLRQIPVLWIWDNVEPVAGFPAGTPSAWTDEEQRELADFLREARETKAKFLLTSRRDEHAWLGDLPARLQLPSMPMQERVQFALALAEKHDKRLTDVEDWQPLLRFTQGNPLTITVLVGQALRDNLHTRAEIEAFVSRLRAGEAAFEDEESEGRTKSLGASLNYGFEHAFTEDERKILVLLHFFQGFVNVGALCVMGDPANSWYLSEVNGLTREAGVSLCDRAAEVGLLTAAGGGYYFIHPALPWFFEKLFNHYYASPDDKETPRKRATRAFVSTMASSGEFYVREYSEGRRRIIPVMMADEANLLSARKLGRENKWLSEVAVITHALGLLYEQTGRRSEWKSLIDEITPDFAEPSTGGPLPGSEQDWAVVTQNRVKLAKLNLDWPEAERLQHLLVDWSRQRAADALKMPVSEIDWVDKNNIRNLSVSHHDLGEIQRAFGRAECVTSYKESSRLAELIGDQALVAVIAFNLGNAYTAVPDIFDLDQAEEWYRHSLKLRDKNDRQGQAKCLSELGSVAFSRFQVARKTNQPESTILQHLNTALEYYQQALSFDPPEALHDLATDHNALGFIYAEGGDLTSALAHWREAARNFEAEGAHYDAAGVHYNTALGLARAGRFSDAREYAYAALRNLKGYGDRATDKIEQAQKLIKQIEKDLQSRGE